MGGHLDFNIGAGSFGAVITCLETGFGGVAFARGVGGAYGVICGRTLTSSGEGTSFGGFYYLGRATQSCMIGISL